MAIPETLFKGAVEANVIAVRLVMLPFPCNRIEPNQKPEP
jgi:hypothetical protein